MKLINARQAWTDSQHESNASIAAAAAEKANTAMRVKREKGRTHEAIFAAVGDDKEERVKIARQKISISETRRTPLGRSTARAAHLLTMAKVQEAIETLPFQVQQLGHYLYHPCLTMVHVLAAEKLIWSEIDVSSLTDAKQAKVHCMVTMALQSYKSEVNGGDGWGPARVAEGMLKLYGVKLEPKIWDRDWKEVWEFLREAIKAVDLQAKEPVWKVIHVENDVKAA